MALSVRMVPVDAPEVILLIRLFTYRNDLNGIKYRNTIFFSKIVQLYSIGRCAAVQSGLRTAPNIYRNN